MNKTSLCRGLMLAVFGLAAYAVSADQTGVLPFKQLRIEPAVRDNTYRFFPQISTEPSRFHEASENDQIAIRRGVSNNIVAGGFNTNTWGTLGPKFAGPIGNGFFPPDCDMSVGPAHIVTVVNTEFAFYTKTGSLLLKQGFGSFFSTQITGGIISDPKVFYDKAAHRWFMSILNADFTAKESWQLLAVSDDADPRGNWFKYKINTKLSDGGNDYWLDYPNFGFDKNGIVISGNMFGFSAGFYGNLFTCVPKSSLFTGGPATASYFKESGNSTTQLTRSSEATQAAVYGMELESTSSLKIYSFTGLNGTPRMSNAIVACSSFEIAPASISTGGQQLDALGDRGFNCYIRGGKFVVAHSIRTPTGNGCRWYEITPGDWPTTGLPVISQQGNVTGAGDAFLPAINTNKAGDIAMIYSLCSSSIPADLMFAARKRLDPRNTMGRPKKWASSVGQNYPWGRWGDYFAVDVDPNDDLTFWGFGMVIASSPDWITFVQSFTVSTAGGSGTATNYSPTAISMYEGTNAVNTVAEAGASDNRYYIVSSKTIARTGQVASAQATFTLDHTASQYTGMTLKAECGAADNLTCSLFAMNWNTGIYEYVGAFPLTAADAVKTVNIPLTSLAKYMNGSKQVKLLFRAVSPIGTNRVPVAFNFRVDQVQLQGSLN